MKLHLTIVAILTLLFATACGTSSNEKSEEESKDEPKKELKEGDNSQSQETDETNSEELSSANQEKELDTKTIKAQFEMMVANTGGTFVVFKTPGEDPVWYRVARDTDDLDFAMGLQPGDRNTEYNGEWYEITYEVRTENRTGWEQERPYILSAEKVDKQGPGNAQSPAITFEDLQNAIFFGTEPFWSIEFKSGHMFYQDGPGQEKEMYNYVVESGSSSPVKGISDNAVQVNVWPVTNGSDQYQWYIIIRKEPCSDGMSDNTYPYSIEITWEDTQEYGEGEIGMGCGRINNNLVKIEDIQRTQKIKSFSVAEVSYNPGSDFNIVLGGTFDFKGRFSIDPMSDMLNFHVAEYQRPDIEIKIEDFSRPLFTGFYFTNEKEVNAALGEQKMKQIRNGEHVEADIVFRNYQVGGKIDGYGGAGAEFVKMVQ